LLRLERALGGLLHGATVHTNVAFAVIDAAAGRMRYARTGDYPKAVAVWRGIPVAPSLETVLAPEGRSIPVVEGEVELAPGYGVFLFTDGVAKRLARFSPAGQPEFLARLDADPRRPAEAVHSALFEKLLPRGRKSHQELEDDLTAVVVRFAQRESDSMGVVA
jgi:hypothetical protein